MSETYGQENLEKMKPAEFYRLYKDFSLGKMWLIFLRICILEEKRGGAEIDTVQFVCTLTH